MEAKRWRHAAGQFFWDSAHWIRKGPPWFGYLATVFGITVVAAVSWIASPHHLPWAIAGAVAALCCVFVIAGIRVQKRVDDVLDEGPRRMSPHHEQWLRSQLQELLTAITRATPSSPPEVTRSEILLHFPETWALIDRWAVERETWRSEREDLLAVMSKELLDLCGLVGHQQSVNESVGNLLRWCEDDGRPHILPGRRKPGMKYDGEGAGFGAVLSFSGLDARFPMSGASEHIEPFKKWLDAVVQGQKWWAVVSASDRKREAATTAENAINQILAQPYFETRRLGCPVDPMTEVRPLPASGRP
jgi:hypothetical protein